MPKRRVRFVDVRFHSPRETTFWIAIVCAVAALMGYLGNIPVLGEYAFWLLLAGFILLVLGVTIKQF